VDKFLQTSFFELVRLGLGRDSSFSDKVDWKNMQALAMQQGLSVLVLDGVEKLPEKQRPPKVDLLQWIGETLQCESQFAIKQKAATKMALLFHKNLIKTYVLKGEIIAECYPKPSHRISSDLDCFLLPINSDFDAWSLGNDLVRTKGFEVETIFYKNSTFWLPGLMVENHQFLTPFRGNKRLKNLERVLQTLLREDKGEDRIEGTWLYDRLLWLRLCFL